LSTDTLLLHVYRIYIRPYTDPNRLEKTLPAILSISLLALAPSLQAMPLMEHPAVTCPATPVSLPKGLEGWARKQPVHAGGTARTATALRLGSGITASLLHASQITYAVRPQKSGGSASSGGMFVFSVPDSGRYRVALGSGAWIDVLRGTTPMTSVAHAHGPDCTGLRKMVDFDLTPGRYLLQIAGNSSAALPMMVVRMP